jgi:hypothetical protein
LPLENSFETDDQVALAQAVLMIKERIVMFNHFNQPKAADQRGEDRGALPAAQAGDLRVFRRTEAGFVCTFAELLIAVVIVAMVFGTIIQGYLVTATRAQWTGYSLAAQSLGLQIVEQSRAAVWDLSSGKNEVTNITLNARSLTTNGNTLTLTGYTTNSLDVPYKSTNAVYVTNFVTIRVLYANNDTSLKLLIQMIKVNTVWPFVGWSNHKLLYYTNSISTYLAPDNRDPASLGVD